MRERYGLKVCTELLLDWVLEVGFLTIFLDNFALLENFDELRLDLVPIDLETPLGANFDEVVDDELETYFFCAAVSDLALIGFLVIE